MRSPSTFSEVRLRPSFFLTIPAKKPRTECCCQSVPLMMAATVVPLGWRSIASTASCLEGEGADAFDGAALAMVAEEVAGFDRAEPLIFSGRLAMRADLRSPFADFGLVLWVATCPSVSANDTIMCGH